MKHIRLNNGYKFYLNNFTFNKVLQYLAFDPYFLDERIDFISELIESETLDKNIKCLKKELQFFQDCKTTIKICGGASITRHLSER